MKKHREVNQMQKDVINKLKMDYIKIMDDIKRKEGNGSKPIVAAPQAAGMAQLPQRGQVRSIKGGGGGLGPAMVAGSGQFGQAAKP